MILLHTMAWLPLGLACFYSSVLHEEMAMVYYPQLLTWAYNAATRHGEIWDWCNFSIDAFCDFIELFFNARSMMWVHKTRLQVQGDQAFAAVRNHWAGLSPHLHDFYYHVISGLD